LSFYLNLIKGKVYLFEKPNNCRKIIIHQKG